MSIRKKLDISKYFVIGPENVSGQSVKEMVETVVKAGFTCIQIRSKVASASELISYVKDASDIIKQYNKSDKVALLVDDRLDVVLAAIELGIKVDGIHVGQSDIPFNICRKLLGEDYIVGLSARTHELFDYIDNVNVDDIDYFGVGPLHETSTKPDCGLDKSGNIIIRSLEEIKRLKKISPLPIVVGGGVKLKDIKGLKSTGVDGFFVISAISLSDDPLKTASDLSNAWDN